MISAQEEMDWLAYGAFGLIPETCSVLPEQMRLPSLDREERPFRLWENGNRECETAVELIPSDWNKPFRNLWKARLATIRDSEFVRQIEQPAYKRRWDEQWKVSNRWQCGPIAYAAEFVEAFEWWLREKAEWWLEHQKSGSVEIAEWVQSLWKDSRVQSAWSVATEEYACLEYQKIVEKAEENGDPTPPAVPLSADFESFKAKFRAVVNEETVPEGFPFGTPYDDLKKKLEKAVPSKLEKVRGKLNVPRERFQLRGRDQYLWAGLQFK
jgi:hypothetical protein